MVTSSFIMIGNKESGKTTSMISAYGQLSQRGIKEFKIKAPDSIAKAELDSMFEDLKNGEYPLATQKRSKYSFNLTYNGSVVHKFEWKDFNGGIIDERPNDATRVLKEDMKDSSGLMLFFDAEKLYKNSVDTRVRRILHLISQNIGEINKPFFMTLVITKFDLLSDAQRRDENTLFAPLLPFINTVTNNEYINFVLIPISCTAKGMVNVELPLLYMLHGRMTVYCSDKYQELMDEIDSYNRCVDKAGFWDDVKSWWNDERSYREIANSKAQKLQPQIDFYNQVLESLNSLKSYLSNINVMDGFKKQKQNSSKYKF